MGEIATLCSHFQATAARHADRTALTTLDGTTIAWGEYGEHVAAAAGALSGLGLGRGEVIACWMGNRPEFHIVDTAALHLGMASFSLYGGVTAEHAEYLVADAGARVLVTEAAHAEAAIAIRARGRTALEHIVCVNGYAPQALGWDELLAFGSASFDFDAAWRSVRPEDLATLIYTSGTTGRPKGVEITHANLLAQALALRERLRFPDGVRALSFLPMAHIAERLCTQYFPMFTAWEVTCCPEGASIPAALAVTRPGFFFSPPRLWERLRATALAAADDAERAELDAGLQRVRAGEAAQPGPAGRAALERTGLDAVEVAIVGSAPVPPELLEFWHACGIPLSELYGLSETAGAATVADAPGARIGTAGPALPGLEVDVAADGEILVRGPVVTRGYRHAPPPVDADGWLHTGDIGALDAHGHLRVVDRIADLFVDAAGERISPATIETAVRGCARLVGQVCAIGDGRPHPVALLTFEPDALRAFAAEIGLAEASLRRLAQSALVLEVVQAEVVAANARLRRCEQIKRFLILDEEWQPDGDELTATMKPKRRSIAKKYAREIAGLYDEVLGVLTNEPVAASALKS
ncbi:MAG: long-chain acyl-CoA synthetase [Solirubrobacteraceae bacterium]|nr:long-chain acyl-CoA synthetase [Solirubrobacteraceae bacterium]